MFRTLKGTSCLATNYDGSCQKKMHGDVEYWLVQMLPVTTQRLEWVREDRLIEVRR